MDKSPLLNPGNLTQIDTLPTFDYSKLFSKSVIGCRLSTEGNFIDLNQAFLEKLEYEHEELLGTSFTDLFHSISFKPIFNEILIDSRLSNWRGEIAFLSKPKLLIWLDVSMASVRDPYSNQIQEFVCVCNDITTYKLQNDRYHTVISSINAGVWDMPDISSKDRYWSPRMYEILKYDPATFVPNANTLTEIFHPEDLPGVLESLANLIKYDMVFTQEHRIKCGDGEFKWVLATAVAIRDESGKAYRVIGSIIDIHQKKIVEEKLEEERQKCIQASKLATLGEMAACLAHEVNNPLTIIFGYIRVLEEEILSDTLSPEVLRNYLSLIKKAADRSAKVVQGLKDFARDGSTEPFEDHSVSEIFSMVLDLTKERFKKNKIQLDVEIINNSIVHCRKIELSQVLLNLLFNSFDAVKDLPVKWVRIKAEKSASLLKISVTDSGPGLIPEVADKVFSPFFTTKQVGQGTGLGLSISERIILNHCGEIFYDTSSLNTRFVICLPLYYELNT